MADTPDLDISEMVDVESDMDCQPDTTNPNNYLEAGSPEPNDDYLETETVDPSDDYAGLDLEALLADSDEEASEIAEQIEGSTATDENTEGAEMPQNSTENTILKLPLSRIRHIIKQDPDVDRINSEALFLVTKATEMFIEMFAKEVYVFTSSKKKKTVQKTDVVECINSVMAFQFLDGVFV